MRRQYKIKTFKWTRCLSNAACFKHDSVCACALSALIFTSGRKFLTENGFRDIDFLYVVEILAARHCFSPILAIFFTAHAQFRPYYYFRFKIWGHIWILRTGFPIIMRSFRARDTIFGDFCDHNVCTCAMSTLIPLPVANLSPEIDSASPIF